MRRLITRLHAELGRYPHPDEINAHLYGPTPPSEIVNALIYATMAFAHRFDRYPTPIELMLGMLTTDTDTALARIFRGARMQLGVDKRKCLSCNG